MNEVVDSHQEVVDSHLSEEVTLTNPVEYYEHLRLLVESLETDAKKTSRGNKSASVRLRKGLRAIRSRSTDFIRFTLGK